MPVVVRVRQRRNRTSAGIGHENAAGPRARRRADRPRLLWQRAPGSNLVDGVAGRWRVELQARDAVALGFHHLAALDDGSDRPGIWRAFIWAPTGAALGSGPRWRKAP